MHFFDVKNVFSSKIYVFFLCSPTKDDQKQCHDFENRAASQ